MTDAVARPPAPVQFEAVAAHYPGGEPVLDGFSLSAEPGRLTCLLGPSGCGKTTALRLLAGLLSPEAGQILIDGQPVQQVPPHRRDVAVVFQQPLLFPHLDVAGNIGFGLRMRGVSRSSVRSRVATLLDLMHLNGLAARRPAELSGGQEQRVALARALAIQPRVLLLDEPLSQLDASLRQEMRDLIRSVQRQLQVTTLFVTHDQEEAAAVADRVAVLLDSRIAQEGTAQDLYERPASLPVARFLGTANLIPGTVHDGTWTGPLGRVPAGVPDGPATLAVRQESLQVWPGAPGSDGPGQSSQTDALPAVVTQAQYRGTSWLLELQIEGAMLQVVTPPTLKAAPGDLVRVSLPPGHGQVLPR